MMKLAVIWRLLCAKDSTGYCLESIVCGKCFQHLLEALHAFEPWVTIGGRIFHCTTVDPVVLCESYDIPTGSIYIALPFCKE